MRSDFPTYTIQHACCTDVFLVLLKYLQHRSEHSEDGSSRLLGLHLIVMYVLACIGSDEQRLTDCSGRNCQKSLYVLRGDAFAKGSGHPLAQE